jgi:two-component system, response regulator YesN
MVAGNGEEAVKIVRADPPNLVLADIMMPVIKGIALLPLLIRRLRTPIIEEISCLNVFRYARYGMYA